MRHLALDRQRSENNGAEAPFLFWCLPGYTHSNIPLQIPFPCDIPRCDIPVQLQPICTYLVLVIFFPSA